MVRAIRKSKGLRGPNPLKFDPTRTGALRKAITKRLEAKFALLKERLWTLLVDEDIFGLSQDPAVHPLALHPTLTVVGRNYLIANCGGPGSGVPGPCKGIGEKAAEHFNKGVDSIHRLSLEQGMTEALEGRLEKMTEDAIRRGRGAASKAWSEVEAKVLAEHEDTPAVRELLAGHKDTVREALDEYVSRVHERADEARAGADSNRADREAGRAAVVRAIASVHDEIDKTPAYVERHKNGAIRHQELSETQKFLRSTAGKEKLTPAQEAKAEKLASSERYYQLKKGPAGWEVHSPAGAAEGSHFRPTSDGLQLYDTATGQPTTPLAIRERQRAGQNSLASNRDEGAFISFIFANCGGPGSGVPGPCPKEGGAAKDEPSGEGHSAASEEALGQSSRAWAKAKALAGKAQAAEHWVKEGVEKQIEKLPTPVQKGLSILYHGAFAGWTASQTLAERVAVARGSTKEEAAKLRGILSASDIAAFKPVSIALSASGVGAAVQAATWIILPATGVYLAYSTLRNPIKTAKAAAGLVKDSLGSAASWASSQVTGNASEALAHQFAAAMEAHNYDDWYMAILCQALAAQLTPSDAIALADDIYLKNPTGPEGEDTDQDAEDLFSAKGLAANASVGRWRFSSTPEQLARFKQWLKKELAEELLSKEEADIWQFYVKQGLEKGAGRAFDDTKVTERTKAVADGGTLLDFYKGSRDEFLRSSFNQPIAVDKVKILASRSFDELTNITHDMSTRITRTLTDGLVQGNSPREIARDLDDDVDIGRGRALTIARTEIVRAHAEGQLMALEDLGVEEVGVAVEWVTAQDDKVCDLCAPLEGVVLKLSEAQGMLPRHPNCRCAWVPANVGEDGEGQKDTKSSILGALTTSVDREGGNDRSRWVGADLEPARERPEAIVGNWNGVLNSISARVLEEAERILNCGGPGSGIPGPCPKDRSGEQGAKPGTSHYGSGDRPYLTPEENKDYGQMHRERLKLEKKVKDGTATDADKARSQELKDKLNKYSALAKERKLGGAKPAVKPEVKPEVKPPEVKPEVKPPEVKPGETKPTDTKPAGTKPPAERPKPDVEGGQGLC